MLMIQATIKNSLKYTFKSP